jgi:anti-sigma factor RsiW
MTCLEARTFLMPYLDDELNVADCLRIEQHLSTCPACSADHDEAITLKTLIRNSDLSFAPPAALASRVQFAVRRAAGSSTTPLYKAPLYKGLAAAAALVVLLAGAYLFTRPSQQNLLLSEVVDSHVRSLQPGHLIDVPSSDHHTVKPWFQGKLDFSPPVPDLAASGWTLIGGRLDYLDNHPVAALVYQRGKHEINVYLWPSSAPAGTIRQNQSRGYNVFTWNRNSMAYWVVSDLNPTELSEFASLLSKPM